MMHYFGTDLTSKGHYLFEVGKESLYPARLRTGDLPFYPEALPYNKYQNGDVGFYQVFGFTILAICGSCSDSRPASKSVFFIEGTFTESQMKEYILNIPVLQRMIKQMPFQIKWNETPDLLTTPTSKEK